MSRVVSFRDLRLIDELAQYNEIELLHPSMDDTMNKYLEQLGFNTSAGVLYVPNKHRDMQGNVAVGFMAVGQISNNREFLASPLCTLIERLIAAAQKDPSLAREMASMMGSAVNFMAMEGVESLFDEEEEFPSEWVEPDYEDVSAQLKMLENLRDEIRGPCYNEYGNVKTPEEYKNVSA